MKKNWKKILLFFILLEVVIAVLIGTGLWFVPGVPVICVFLFLAVILARIHVHSRRRNEKNVYYDITESNDISGRVVELRIGGVGSMSQLKSRDIRDFPWRKYCDEITRVVIENGVTDVYDRAFSDCKNLTEVFIPDSVTHIGNFAFERCPALNHLQISPQLTNIGTWAFMGCTGLADADGFVIVNGVLFQYDGNETTVRVPDDVTFIGAQSFEYLMREGLYEQGTYWYSWPAHVQLTELYIPDSVTRIDSRAFFHQSALSRLRIPAQLTDIGEQAFMGCSGLADADGFVIVNGILFQYIGKAEKIRVPDTVTVIGEHAFETASGLLKEVTIPGSVSRIETMPFQNNGELTTLYFEGDAPEMRTNRDSFYLCGLGVSNRIGQMITICYYADAKGWTESYKQMILDIERLRLQSELHFRELQR